VLLFRGAKKNVLNFAGQTAYEVRQYYEPLDSILSRLQIAVIAGNAKMANIISSHSEADAG
jgi:hypothetical protein